MSDGTKIEWAANADGTPGASWNPIRARNRADGRLGWFCVHASGGCKGCYAEAMNQRLGTGVDYKAQLADLVDVHIDEKALTQPLRWKRPRTIFVCSMTDLFGEFVTEEMIQRIFAVMAVCPQHTFIVLTKRSARMRQCLDERGPFRAFVVQNAIGLQLSRPLPEMLAWPLPNVWLGVSAEDQRTADERIPDLLLTPAAVRHVSLEPLLGAINLTNIAPPSNGYGGRAHGLDALSEYNRILRGVLDWVIVGGESGASARPMHPAWAQSLRDQCASAGVPFFFKQWGAWAPDSFDGAPGRGGFVSPDGTLLDDVLAVSASDCEKPCRLMFRVGKRAAGRMLDGRMHDERPPLAHQRPAA